MLSMSSNDDDNDTNNNMTPARLQAVDVQDYKQWTPMARVANFKGKVLFTHFSPQVPCSSHSGMLSHKLYLLCSRQGQSSCTTHSIRVRKGKEPMDATNRSWCTYTVEHTIDRLKR